MIAVHAGAGFHSPSLEAAYKRDLAAACRAGAAALASGGDALAAVTAAIAVLEASAHCNAGRGSNLTFGGVVECDASVMEGDGTFGAVAAAPGIERPIKAAALLARESRQPLSNGRVRPLMLAGDRAREWALSRGLPAAATPTEAAGMHLTEASQRQWRKYRRIVERSTGGASSSRETGGSTDASTEVAAEEAAGPQAKRRQRPGSGSGPGGAPQQHHHQQQQPDTAGGCLYDTVGCVVLAPGGRVAAGVSSGGIALKAEGRVGEAAVFGAGCWAQEADPAGDADAAARQEGSSASQQGQQHLRQALPAVACSVTGVGEHVIRHVLARDCCQAAAAAGATATAANTDGSPGGSAGGAAAGEVPLADVAAQLLQRTILRGPPPHDCGLLCLRVQPLGSGVASSSDDVDGGSAAGLLAGGRQQQETGRQPLQAAGRQLCVVEVAVAHSAQSMAFGHMRCDAAAAALGPGAAAGKQAPAAPAPAVHVLRRAAGAAPVQTYLHGATVAV